MVLDYQENRIPGTIIDRKDADGLTGLPFLKHLFLASDSVMLSTIRGISGIDTSTLQNWVKRGWVGNSANRHYNIEQVAHILIINMLRSCMQLDHIAFLLHYINGELDDTSDDIVSDTRLFDYICRMVDKMEAEEVCRLSDLPAIAELVISDYEEILPGAKKRLIKALEVIAVTYCATTLKEQTVKLLNDME